MVAELAESASPAEAVQSLTAAVSRRLDLKASNVFCRVDQDFHEWKIGGSKGPPPSLPLLALAVLAATRMAREEGISAANYYLRFRRLLNLGGTGQPRGYSESVPFFWQQLKSWLNDANHGRLGVSTVTGNEHLTNIGFALSQALFRTADRQRLTHFFQWIDLQPGDEIPGGELLALFRSWAPRRSSIHSGVLKMADSEQFAEQLTSILQTEARHWDGALRDESGRRLGRILVVAQLFPKPKLSFFAQCPPGFPDHTTFASNTGLRVSVSRQAEGWYGELAIASAHMADLLQKGLKLESDGFALEYKADRVVPLSENKEISGWASTRQVYPGEPHWILARSDSSAAVASYLQRYAEEGWRLYERRESFPAGWDLFRDVLIDKVPIDVLPELARIAPAVRERPAFFGGLPLSKYPATYLWLGEPDLWIPPSFAPDARTVTIDDRVLDRPETGQVALCKVGLPAGAHRVQVGPSTRQFGTIRTMRDPKALNKATLGYTLVRDGSRLVTATINPSAFVHQDNDPEVHLIGASITRGNVHAISKSYPPLLFPKGAAEYILIGAKPGELLRVTEPPPPEWAAILPLYSKVFEILPEFEAVWLVIRWRTAPPEIRLVSGKAPLYDPTAGGRSEPISEWARTIKSTPDPAEPELDLWNEYEKVAQEIRL